jgi:hypothetical protein
MILLTIQYSHRIVLLMSFMLRTTEMKKTITIDQDVYERLCCIGSKKDTFSTIIDRLISKQPREKEQ